MTKILINIPDELLEEVDRRAKEEKMTRSEATRLALRAWLQSERYIPPFRRPGFAEIEERMRAAARLHKGSVPAESLVRRERERH